MKKSLSIKKVLSIITVTATIAIVMVACKPAPFTPQHLPMLDTTGFAQFQAWKAMNQQEANKAINQNVAVKKTRSVNKSGSITSSSTNNAMVAKKKGWSKAAKYSAIGGGSGAVLGAVINKRNRVAGGIIGGVLGGGLGYVFGRSQDKKDGRY